MLRISNLLILLSFLFSASLVIATTQTTEAVKDVRQDKEIITNLTKAHKAAKVAADIAIEQELINKAFLETAQDYDIPVTLLRAVCWVESNHTIDDFAFDDGGVHNHSFGICQVLYTTAKYEGFSDRMKDCSRDIFKKRKNRTYQNCRLFGPRTNMKYAAIELRNDLDIYDGDWREAVAAYNAGRLIQCHHRKTKFHYNCKRGELLNESYVRRVMKALRENR